MCYTPVNDPQTLLALVGINVAGARLGVEGSVLQVVVVAFVAFLVEADCDGASPGKWWGLLISWVRVMLYNM